MKCEFCYKNQVMYAEITTTFRGLNESFVWKDLCRECAGKIVLGEISICDPQQEVRKYPDPKVLDSAIELLNNINRRLNRVEDWYYEMIDETERRCG